MQASRTESHPGTDPAGAGETALELFRVAAMMLGREDAAVACVERALAAADIDPCAEDTVAHRLVLEQTVAAALERLATGGGDGFTAPAPSGMEVCLEGDDLTSSGVSAAEFAALLGGGGRERLRRWLDSLPAATRAVFVMRAVAHLDNGTAAELLRGHAGPAAGGWTAAVAGDVFRQGLCSLASQLVQGAD